MGRVEPAPIVDSHAHYWDPTALHYPWLADGGALGGSFLPVDHERAHAGRVAGVVAVQADCRWGQEASEVDWLESLCGSTPVLGIVAAARLEDPSVHQHLEELAGRKSVVGVRRLLQDQPPGFALTPEFVDGVRSLATYGLTFDICIRAHQLREVFVLASLCPDTVFVLDHCAKPAIARHGLPTWAEDMNRLARLPNVHCKLSGLMTEADRKTVGEVPRYLAEAVRAFGADRLLFGSDWPVCTTATTWVEWFDLVQSVVSARSARDQAAIFGQNAIDVYGLNVPAAHDPTTRTVS